MKKNSVLAFRIIMGFVVLAILICFASTGFGYMQYKEYIQKQYNDTAYQVAEVFRDFFMEDELYQYIQTAKDYKNGIVSKEELVAMTEEAQYQKINAQLAHLRENMGANDIYLAYLDAQELYDFDGNVENWHPMTYIFDSYIQPELVFTYGDMGGLNPEFIEDAIYVAETGQRTDNFFVSKSDYGYNTSAILPIVRDGKAIAVVGVEIPMLTLQKALQEYVSRSILSMVLVTVVCLAVYMNYLLRTMIAPIKLIAQEASKFVEEENKISDRLDKIHTKDEIQQLSETLLKMEIDINQYIDNLTRVTAEKERIGAELNVATQIQADMLPQIFPAFPGREEFDIYAQMDPAKEVGGDFYDFFLVDEDHLAMVVADVSGKGIPAALFMVIAKTLIKNEAQMGKSPKDVVESVSNQLCENNEADMFVTAWLGILEISTGKLTAVNAGHEYPMVKQDGEAYKLLEDPHGFVMAVMRDMEHETYELQLKKGDSIFVYSDGAPDAADVTGEQFERQRLLDSLNKAPDRTPKEIVVQMREDIDNFVGEAEQFDDITLLCFTYHGNTK